MTTTNNSDRVDPRVTRTKTELRAALRELMTHRRWDKIRVQDILEATGISRSAFYAHYGNKFDLLIDGIPELRGPFDDGEPDYLGLFVHLNDVAEFLRPLLSQPVFGEILASYQRTVVSSWIDYFDGTEHADDWVLAEALAGALLAVARAYASQREREDPEAIAKRFEAHVGKMLAVG